MIRPVTIEIVGHLATTYSHCSRCDLIFMESGLQKEVNDGLLDEYPPEMKEELLRLSEWIRELGRLYRHRVVIRLIEAKSFQGLVKALVHRFRTYPVFIVDKRKVLTGWDWEGLQAALDSSIGTPG